MDLLRLRCQGLLEQRGRRESPVWLHLPVHPGDFPVCRGGLRGRADCHDLPFWQDPRLMDLPRLRDRLRCQGLLPLRQYWEHQEQQCLALSLVPSCHPGHCGPDDQQVLPDSHPGFPRLLHRLLLGSPRRALGGPPHSRHSPARALPRAVQVFRTLAATAARLAASARLCASRYVVARPEHDQLDRPNPDALPSVPSAA